MVKIKNINAQQIIDSRGFPTLEVTIATENNVQASASVPSGASTGKHEALELRDDDDKNYFGKSVFKAINNIEDIIKKHIVGMDVFEQQRLDISLIELDGTPDKSKLGANAILGTSLAVLKAAALERSLPLYKYINSNNEYFLPMPLINIINGGAHADNNLDIQEFMIVPVGAKNFTESMKMGMEVFYTLGKILKKNGYNINKGDEGGYAPNLSSNEQAFEYILEAIKGSGYRPGADISLALDVAASEFYDEQENFYYFNSSRKNSEEMINIWQSWVKKYRIVSIEDPLAEDDWVAWSRLTKCLINSKKLKNIEDNSDLKYIVGDDIFTTNLKRLKKGIDSKVANSILVKMNQIGTISETIEVIKYAQDNNFSCIISHRSGETEDTSIADLAVAFDCKIIKTGSLSRSERICKYNRLLRIEKELGGSAKFDNPFV